MPGTGSTTPGSGVMTPSRRNFVLRVEDELVFKRGKINLIIGPTGSGKTSLLMALLGTCFAISLTGWSVCSTGSLWFGLDFRRRDALCAFWSWLVVQSTKGGRCGVCCTGIVGTE